MVGGDVGEGVARDRSLCNAVNDDARDLVAAVRSDRERPVRAARDRNVARRRIRAVRAR